MSFIRRTYDQGYFANTLHKSSPDSHRNHQRLRVVLENSRQGRLLEIGPGVGDFLTTASHRFDVEGIEVSQHALTHVPPKLRDKIFVGNIESTSLEPCRYEVVVAFNVLEHLRDPSSVINKIRWSLTPDGCLVGSVPNNAGVVGRPHTQVGNYFDRTHCSTFEPEGWRAVFSQAGFSSVDFFGELPLGPKISLHVRRAHWRHVCPNLMFVCR